MNYPSEQIQAMCRKYGPTVGPLPAGVDGAQLLWAISGVESTHGANCTPRFERAYFTGGRYADHAPMPALLALYGSGAAHSYGPWQVLLCNLPAGTTPQVAMTDLERMAEYSVSHLNMLLRHFKPASLDQIGECWNAGHITPDPDYERKLRANYAVLMPGAQGE